MPPPFRENTHSPRQVAHEECSRRLRVNFNFDSEFVVGGFFLLNVFNFWIETIQQ